MITISQEAEEWFKHIKYTGAPMMDAFHMCFIIGVHAALKDKRMTILDYNHGKQFASKGIPSDYQSSFPASIGLMLEAELERKTYDREDKDALSRFLNTYLSAESNVKMTSDGAKLMSNYSYKGFEILKAKIEKTPANKIIFIKEYTEILKEYIE